MSLARFARVSGTVSVSNVVSVGANMLKNKALALLVGSAGIGLLSQASYLQNLLMTVSNLGLNQGLLRVLSRRKEPSSEDFRLAADLGTRVMVWSCAGFGLLALALARPVSRFAFDSPERTAWVFAAVLAFLPWSVGMVVETVLVGAGEIPRFTAGRISTYLLTAGAIVIGTWWRGIGGGIWGGAVGCVLATGVAWSISFYRTSLPRLCRRSVWWDRDRWAEERPVFAELAGVSSVASVDGLLCMVGPFVLRSVALHAVGAGALGLYQAAQVMAVTLGPIVSNSIWGHYFPAASAESDPRKLSDLTNAAVRFATLTLVPAYLCILLLKGWLVPVLFSKSFIPILPWLSWLMAGEFLSQVAAIMMSLSLARDHHRIFLAACFMRTGGLLLIGWLALGSYGMEGLVMAQAFSGALLCAFGLWAAVKKVGVELNSGSLAAVGLAVALLLALG
ncbi:MAG: oligosaccharide flippase family protein [Elusimicrobia bacterium]|nr:oligosaccharide flippase family protein [Elusimicrobiota bacterium]